MKQTLGIQQTLKQQLTLSPQLIQTFEILAMSTLELQQRIKAEIEQNPALEIPSERVVSIERISAAEGRKRTDDDLSDTTTFPSERLGSSTRLSYTYNQEAADSNLQFLEGALSTQETLQEYLLRQLGCLSLSEEEFELGSLIISNIDYNGFHRNPVDSLVPQKRLSSLLDALAIVQKLDPPGIAAKDFRESLLLQAQDDQLLDEDELILFKALVYDHLEQLRLQKFSEVASEMKVDEHTITTLFQYLKSLNPYPGLQYDSRETHYIIPDLYVRKIEGRLQLRLNTEQVPTLTIDPEFTSLEVHKSSASRKEVNSYINNAVRSAKELIEQIAMRSETMKKIGLELLKFQHEFFLNGPRYLKPLTYRHIAEDLKLHETTISRAVQGKYIDTDWGILPIKELFSSALQTTIPGQQEVSKTAVKDMVKEIIDQHTGERALSDQKIADMLVARGIQIARRTVNKYRKELNIDSSYERV